MGVIVMTGLAVVLGLFRIGAQSLWTDELFSAHVARGSWQAMWSFAAGSEFHSGVYHLASWLWVQAFGDSESALRSPSVVFGVAAMVMVMVTARRLFSTRTALIAGAVFLVQVQTVRYFQEARTYSLAMFAAAAATLALARALEDGSSRSRWLQYGVVAGVACYAHLFVFFVIASHGVALVLRRSVPKLRDALLAAGAFLLVTSPLVLAAAVREGDVDWLPATNLRAVAYAARAVTVGNGTAAMILLVALWLWKLWTSRQGPSREMTSLVVVASWVVSPFVIAIAIGTVRPLFVPHYLNVCVPGAAVLTAATIDSLIARSRALGAVSLAVLLVHSGYYVARWYDGTPAKEDFRAAVRFACDRASQQHARVLFRPTYVRSSMYYADDDCGEPIAGNLAVVIQRGEPAEPTPSGERVISVRLFTGVTVETIETR
ncbi:MAG: glycosyltransferase family 39 protein [Actinobacteria bacterium]|nr:glycosyltransferase family 39 protein [Actinomycetota bacterium]